MNFPLQSGEPVVDPVSAFDMFLKHRVKLLTDIYTKHSLIKNPCTAEVHSMNPVIVGELGHKITLKLKET